MLFMRTRVVVETVICLVGVAAIFHSASPSHAEMTIVSPSSLADTEGNGSTAGGSGQQTRDQFLFPASDFASLPESHRTIVAMAWRPDGPNGLMDPVSGPAQLRLSTTSADSLSTVFAENLASDETLVFDGTVTWQTNNQPPENPRNFDFEILFETPFTYDPGQGNLLLEFVAPMAWDRVGDWAIDAHTMPSGNITFVGTPDPLAEFATNFASGSFPTQFTFVDSDFLQAGDADMDGDFDQLDLVRVQISAKYVSGQTATWGEGDWNGAPGGSLSQQQPPAGDGRFDQLDIIAALTTGLYLQGTAAALTRGGDLGPVDLIYIPEPSTMVLLGLGLIAALVARWKGQS